MRGRHLQFYMDCIQTGEVKDHGIGSGLCACAGMGDIDEETLFLFEPNFENQMEDENSAGWWGAGLPSDDPDRHYKFTPLRQTIVLFMAAINGEL